MKVLSIFLNTSFLIIFHGTIAQSDTIYCNNEKIACIVKEITPEAVKFSYPNEDLINSIYKNTIQKIVFHSGRIQTFAENTSFKKVNGPTDWESVTITPVESEVKGLFKLGDVSSKAAGTTEFSNQERVKQRAYRKLKIHAAFLGANVIYLTASRTQGNSYYQSSEASFTGVAYSNLLPSFEDFKALLKDKTKFTATKIAELWSSSSDMLLSDISHPVNIKEVYTESGLIMINASIKGMKEDVFQVVNFNSDSFLVYFRDKRSIYNLKIDLN
jgi:hypothetical protein